jgi:hypothetical protein
MRTSEQGLLARLGFRDADREDPRHDKACRFFTRPDIAERVLGVVHPASDAWRDMHSHYNSAPPPPLDLRTEWAGCHGFNEAAVRTKTGFHIGFIDTVVRGACRAYSGPTPVANGPSSVTANIEVKIARTCVSEVIRQIETYRGGAGYALWVLAVDYALSEEERRALTAQRITPIRIGAAFEAYLLETDAVADVVAL